MDAASMEEMMKTNWIWTPEWKITDDEKPQIVYFRKEFVVAEGKVPDTKKIRITADSRYKLYLNGSFVQEGPQKAMSLREWFVDEAEVAPYLREGQSGSSGSAPATRRRTSQTVLRARTIRCTGQRLRICMWRTWHWQKRK